MLGRMWAAVRPGGVIIVEDADFDGWCCHPANDSFDFFLRAYSQVLARWGGDHALGRKLYRCCLDAGIPHLNVRMVQPLYLDGEGKTLPWSTLEACRDAILDAGIASEDEVDSALEGLAGITHDTRSLICGPRIFQVWAKREQGDGLDLPEQQVVTILPERYGDRLERKPRGVPGGVGQS
jgi:hypothetical protein